jgi:YHS domain-containing protein
MPQSIGAFIFAALLLIFSASLSFAGDRYSPTEGTVAINGYDPVAYFTMGEPVRGDPSNTMSWQGKVWYFSSQDHLEAFQEEPRRYAPRYGGFCAGAMSRGLRAPVDPEAFAVIDGKLYLAYSKSDIENFEAKSDTAIPKADANWERLGDGS